MWKSYLQVRENDTAKTYKLSYKLMKVKRIVNAAIVYIVHLVKVHVLFW